MKLSSKLGFSIYPSTWQEKRKQLSSLFQEGSAVFTSLHISEEFSDAYVGQVEEMMAYLNETGYEVIADVSRRSLEIFSEDSLVSLAERLKIDVLRVDYGFTQEEILLAAQKVPVCFNASTLTEEDLMVLKETGKTFYAMYNFYPRPETGIDREQFMKRNELLKHYGLGVMAFIPGESEKRRPLYDGLPTLEEHRHQKPYVSFVDLMNGYGIKHIFVGDGLLTEEEAEPIRLLLEEGVYSIPVSTLEKEDLLSKNFTVRIDSPQSLIRVQESREYATPGAVIEPSHTTERKLGSITIDNKNYGRYSGEVQILRETFERDDRVNVIGQVDPCYHSLLKNIPNGAKIRLTKK